MTWSRGNPCPNCGSNLIAEFHLDVEYAMHGGGQDHFKSSGDRIATLKYECDECGTVLDELDPEEVDAL